MKSCIEEAFDALSNDLSVGLGVKYENVVLIAKAGDGVEEPGE